MRNDLFEFWFFVIAGSLVVAVLAIVANASCKSRWDGSGMGVTWGPVQGCKVQLQDGRWLPEDRVREIDIAPREQAPATQK